MITNNFGKLLSNWVKVKKIDRKKLIASLQASNYEEFKGIDAITISRWFNGNSSPSLYRQLLIVHALNIDPIEFIIDINVASNKHPKKYMTIINILVNALDLSMNVFSYAPLSKNTMAEIKIHSKKEHDIIFNDFYDNISALKQLRENIASASNDIKYHDIMLKNKNGTILGHWSCIINMDELKGCHTVPLIPTSEIDESCLVQLGYFNSSKHFFELISLAISYYFITLWKKKKYVYIFATGKSIIDFSTHVFNAEIISCFPPTRRDDRVIVYLLKFDILKSTTNPVLFPKIKKRISCIPDCNNCGKCNLKDYHTENQVLT